MQTPNSRNPQHSSMPRSHGRRKLPRIVVVVCAALGLLIVASVGAMLARRSSTGGKPQGTAVKQQASVNQQQPLQSTPPPVTQEPPSSPSQAPLVTPEPQTPRPSTPSKPPAHIPGGAVDLLHFDDIDDIDAASAKWLVGLRDAALPVSIVVPVCNENVSTLLLSLIDELEGGLGEIVVSAAPSVDQELYLRERSVASVKSVALRFVTVPPVPPFVNTSYGQRLQAGLNASRSDRVLFVSPFVQEVHPGFVSSMLQSSATVATCAAHVIPDVRHQQHHHQQRRALPRLTARGGYVARPSLPGWDVVLERRTATQNAIDLPGVHCLLVDGPALRESGGFSIRLATSYDQVTEELAERSASRDAWAFAIDVEVTNTEFTMASIEVRDLATMAPKAKAQLRGLTTTLSSAERQTKALGRSLTHDVRAMSRRGLLRRQDPQQGATDVAVMTVTRLLEQVLQQTAVVSGEERVSLDSLAWLAVLRMCNGRPATTIDVIPGAFAHVVLPSQLSDTDLGTTATARLLPPRLVSTLLERSTSLIPFRIFTVYPDRDAMPADDLSGNADASWATEAAFSHKRLTLEDCAAIAANAAPGASTAMSMLPFSAQKARYCGLLAVLRHGGIYRDFDVSKERELSTWLTVSSPRLFVPRDDASGLLDLSFFAARASDTCLRHMSRTIIAQSARMSSLDAGIVSDGDTLARWISAELGHCASANEPTVWARPYAEGHLKHWHASVNWPAPYTSLQAQSEHLTVESGRAPPRRIVYMRDEEAITETERAATAAWVKDDPGVSSFVIEDRNCSDVLGRTKLQFTRLHTATGTQRRVTRRFVCTVAAIYAVGGVSMPHHATPVTKIMNEWIPKATDFFYGYTGTAATTGKGRPDPHGVRLPTVYGGLPASPCAMLLLKALDGAATQWSRTQVADESSLARLFADTLTACSATDNKVTRGRSHVTAAKRFASSDLDRVLSIPRVLQQFTWPVTPIDALPMSVVLATPLSPTSTATIPRRVWLIKPRDMTPTDAAVHGEWLVEEGVPRDTLGDDMCRTLARRFPDLGPVYDALPLDIMRADVCRLLALFHTGGVYMDLDVRWRRPMADWFDPTQSLVLGLVSDQGDAPLYGNWFIAATPRHPCIHEALTVFAKIPVGAMTASLETVGLTGSRAMSAAMQTCFAGTGITPLPVGALERDFVLHRPNSERGWRQDLNSFVVAGSWKTRVVISQTFGELTPIEADIMKVWREKEPRMEHRVATVEDCMNALIQDGRAYGPQLARRLPELPTLLQVAVCRFALAMSLSALSMSSDVEWSRPLIDVLPLKQTFVLAVSTEDPNRVDLGAFAIKKESPCVAPLLEALDLRVGTANFTDFINGDWRSFAVGETLVRDVAKSCPYVSTPWHMRRRENVLPQPDLVVPFTRITFSKFEHPRPGVEELNSIRWRLEQPTMKQRHFSVFDCKDVLASFPSVRQHYDSLPHRFRQIVCPLALVHRYGGFYVDQLTGWRGSIENWLPSTASVIVPYDSFGNPVHWFFGSVPGHPCLRRALEVIGHRLTRVGAAFSDLSEERKGRIAGAQAFRDALRSCQPSVIVNADSPVYYMEEDVVVPVGQYEQIPRTIHLVWKSTKLEHIAGAIDAEWRLEEPGYQRRVVTDDECRDLAGRIPGLLPRYDALPLNVMRADTCRVLAVYWYGGIYMDIDVAWARTVDTWLDLTADIVVANETKSGGSVWHFCNWFFAAKPKHPCLLRVLEVILDRADPRTVRHNRLTNPHFVHFTTGPAAFSDGLRGCADPKLNWEDVTRGKIFHMYASTNWKSTEYESWRSQRDAMQPVPLSSKPAPPQGGG